MFLGRIHSPANPIQGSALSTYGYKPSGDILAFSVGDQCGDDSYVTKMNGAMPLISISNGILTFSIPQTHSYVGIGDKVSWATGDVYISKKISTRQWEVKNNTGDVPADISNQTLVSIDKVFPSLYDAIHGSSSDIETLIGSNDLVGLNLVLLVPCYEKTSDNSDPIDITGWLTSSTNYIKVFSPKNVSTECNKAQDFNIASNAGTTLIQCSDDYVYIEALSLEEDAACTNGIDIQGAGTVSNCKIKGFSCGILATEAVSDVIIARNIVYGTAGLGINASASTKLLCNTVYGYPTGYSFAAGAYGANCIASNNATAGFSGTLDIYNCSSDDATAVGTNCVINANTQFYDAANGDFRLTNANDPQLIRSGLDLSSYALFPIDTDASGDLIDNTWSIGALHRVLDVPYAIGDTGTDIKTAGNISDITNGIVTFDTAQANDLVSAGDIVTSAAGAIILTEKIDSTHWRTTLDTGFAPADYTGPTAITSIYPQFDSISALIADASTPKDLVTDDINLNIVCVEKTLTSGASVVINSAYTCDTTRGINVYAPTLGLESNSRRRHLGVWDEDLMSISDIVVENTGGYVSISGLQITGGSGIDCENSLLRVESCIVKDSSLGVSVKPEAAISSKILVFNNIVYDCDQEGVLVSNDNSEQLKYDFAIYNNTVYNCAYGISVASPSSVDSSIKNNVRLINNLCILNTKDIFGDALRSETISSESNWTSDSSAFNLKLDFNNDVFKTVVFKARRDFHISLAQHLLMPASYAAYADHFFQNYIDSDSDTRPENKQWSIGADQYNLPTKNVAYFSVGREAGDLQGDPGMAVSVSDSIAEFGSPLDAAIGIGDKVTLSGHDFYLAEKGSSTVWRVVDNVGAPVSSDYDDTLVDIQRVSNSLALAMSADIAVELGGFDLTAVACEVRVECYQDATAADTAAVTISGWTTDADYFLTIESPYDTFTQCGRRQRHEGVWSVNYYHLETSADAIDVNTPYTVVDGLQIDSNTNDGLTLSDSCTIERCIVKDSDNGIIQSAAGYSVKVNSNIVYNTSTVAIDIKEGSCNNNTAVSDTGTLYLGLIGATMVNNIGQGSATNFSTAGTMVSCLSEDATASGTGCKDGITLNFTNGYHLARNDFPALNYGASDTNNPLLDIDSEEIIEYSIGADSSDVDTIVQTFSCGTDPIHLKPDTVTVIDGVATFNEDLADSAIMIGDKITYDTSKVAYLNKKLSSTSWSVVNEIGENPESVSNATLNSITRTFVNIENVFDPLSADSVIQLYDFDSLSKARIQLNISMSRLSSASNVEDVVVDNLDANEDNYIRLYAPFADDECNSTHTHDGVNGGAGIIWNEVSLPTAVLYINEPYTVIEGLTIRGRYLGMPDIYVNAAGCVIKNNIIYRASNGIECSASILNTLIVNNIIYYCGGDGIKTSLKDYVYSNTIVGANIGINDAINTVLINNIVQDCPGGCYALGAAEYCADDDGTASGTGCITATFLFVNKSGYNFNLHKNDPRGVGRELISDGAYSFDYDAVNNDRGRFWDMGALEFQAVKTVYYSVGDSTDHKTGTSPQAGVSNGIITFTTPQTSEKLISGDKVIDASYVIGYLGEKISDTEWFITHADGTPVTSGTHIISSISRAFPLIYSALNAISLGAYLGSSNLVSVNTQVNIVLSNDYASLSGFHVNSFTCDVDYFIRIFTPINDKNCNSSHRHSGIYISGSNISSSDQYTIQVTNSHYLELSGLVVSNASAIGVNIYISGSLGCLVDSNIVRGGAFGGIDINNDSGALDGYITTVVNNIISNCAGGGVTIRGTYENIAWIINNTIYNSGKGVYIVKPASSGIYAYAYNNICQANNFSDFLEDHISNARFFKYYNISEDGTSGLANYNFVKKIDFIDIVSENFAPDTSSVAINSALDMRGVSLYYFDKDAKYVDREDYQWDRGAIEQNEVTASGELQLGPISIQNQAGIVSSIFPTTILYLRAQPYETVPPHVQFTSIALLNVYLAWNDIDNIIIYVGGGQEFSGVFELNNRGSRTVTIMTDPNEIKSSGFAKLQYTNWIVDNTSLQSELRFENIEIRSDNAMTKDYLISPIAATTKMVFVNCIVQVNKDALIDIDTCIIECINSIIVYLNTSGSSSIYLAKSSITGHKAYNSIFVVEESFDVTFQITDGTLDDYINNCLIFNFGGNSSINAPGRKIDCLESVDPQFYEIESFTSPDAVMASNFEPIIESPVIDAGDSDVISDYDIETDIEGKARRFRFNDIDIGPYEGEVHIFDLSSSDIRSVSQKKINLDRINKTLKSDNIVYSDLYAILSRNWETLDEFIRDDKIVIELKYVNKQIEAKTDKVNTLLDEFEAYYDNEASTIIVTKSNSESNTILGHIMDDDAYVLNFNEREHKLYLYLNEAVTMGLSGINNPIRGVRFGGNPIFNG